MTATTWEPGLPLHTTRGHGGYLRAFIAEWHAWMGVAS